MKEGKKTVRGLSRVEFLKNISEIKLRIDEGHTYSWIHKTLMEQGKITMSYRVFCRIIQPKKQL